MADVAAQSWLSPASGVHVRMDPDSVAPTSPTRPNLEPSSDTGRSASDDVTSDNTPLLSGSAEPGSLVELVNGLSGTDVIASVVALADGSYAVNTSTLSEGPHAIAAVSIDTAANRSPRSPTLLLTIGEGGAAVALCCGRVGPRILTSLSCRVVRVQTRWPLALRLSPCWTQRRTPVCRTRTA